VTGDLDGDLKGGLPAVERNPCYAALAQGKRGRPAGGGLR
jgi:hypothetical protein